MSREHEMDALKAEYGHPYPNIFIRRDLKAVDIDEFSQTFQIPLEEAQDQILYFEVHGKSIEKIVENYKMGGVEISRREAAHAYFNFKFVNRTIDAREAQKSKS